MQANHGGYHGYAADQEDPDYSVCKMSVLGRDMIVKVTDTFVAGSPEVPVLAL